jgi:hypothetical protein
MKSVWLVTFNACIEKLPLVVTMTSPVILTIHSTADTLQTTPPAVFFAVIRVTKVTPLWLPKHSHSSDVVVPLY